MASTYFNQSKVNLRGTILSEMCVSPGKSHVIRVISVSSSEKWHVIYPYLVAFYELASSGMIVGCTAPLPPHPCHTHKGHTICLEMDLFYLYGFLFCSFRRPSFYPSLLRGLPWVNSASLLESWRMMLLTSYGCVKGCWAGMPDDIYLTLLYYWSWTCPHTLIVAYWWGPGLTDLWLSSNNLRRKIKREEN